MFYLTDVQGVVSRPTAFDGTFPVFSPDDIAGLNATRLWLNVEVISVLIPFFVIYISSTTKGGRLIKSILLHVE